MAFENARLTNEQKEEFRKRGIKRPTSNNIVIPLFMTVDKETNNCLWQVGNFGRDDFHDYRFLFEWCGKEYSIIMKYSNPVIGKVIWSLSQYEKNFKGNELYIPALKKALGAYGIDGSPKQQGNVEIMIKFGGDL